MGTRITSDEGKIAMFDSTSGIAFGPVFDENEPVSEFFDWLTEKEKNAETFPYNGDTLMFLSDVRTYRPNELEEIVRLWREE